MGYIKFLLLLLLVFVEGGKPENAEKKEQGENQQQT